MSISLWTIIYGALCVFAASYVKGYSGFAFSMILVTTLSLVYRPAEVVPPVLILEVLASAWMAPRALGQAHWRTLGWLLAGLAVGTPFGVAMLASLPASAMRAGIASVVLVLAFLLRRGLRVAAMPGDAASGGVGIISGLLNGGAAIGGMPVSIFYFSSPASASASRASLVIYLLAANIWTGGVVAWRGLMGWQTAAAVGAMLPIMLLGVICGARTFKGVDDARFRRHVLNMMIVLSLAGLLRAVLFR